jgi:signal transduction histidine kinase
VESLDTASLSFFMTHDSQTELLVFLLFCDMCSHADHAITSSQRVPSIEWGKTCREKEKEGLLRKLVNLQELERARISRELHDQCGQDLVALQLNMGYLKSFFPKSLSENPCTFKCDVIACKV